MEYNLLDENWIPVLYNNGVFRRVGIIKAFQDAHLIRQIAATNPMDQVALLRFLLAVLLWCKKDAKPSLAELDEKSVGIPEDWLYKLKEKEKKPAFNLLGDGKRFYQDESLKGTESRPIGDLLVEFPTETKIVHFRHVRDKEYGFCPACCALGVIRFCTFANYAGKGYTSGINGPAPAYAISLGSTLLKTLCSNCPEDNAPNRKPPWLLSTAPQEQELDFPTVFAWRARKIWLRDPDGEEDCAFCGRRANLIWSLAFSGGWPQPFQTGGQERKFWHKDPHLIMVNNAAADEVTDDTNSSTIPAPRKKSTQTVLGFPRPGHPITSHAGFWRRAVRAVLKANPAAHTVLVAGPAASQTGMLYQDAAKLNLCIPSVQSSSIVALNAQQQAIEGIRSILRSSTPNPKAQHTNRSAALNSLSPLLENGLRSDIERSEKANLVDSLGRGLATPIERIVGSTTVGSPLRRRAARDHALALLNKKINEIVGKASQPAEISTSDDPAKSKRSRKKGDSK